MQLAELAELSQKGAPERVLETEIVQVFKTVGWPRLQINQDEAIYDKATDKADIVLRIEQHPILFAEVKRFGSISDGEAQIRRYSSLLKPSPKFAILTDGVQWRIYYVGLSHPLLVLHENIMEDCAQAANVLKSLAPQQLRQLEKSKAFGYLNLIEQALEGLSEEARIAMSSHFITTVRTLLTFCETAEQPRSLANIVDIPSTPTVVQEARRPDKPIQLPPANSTKKLYNAAAPPKLDYTRVKGRVGQENVSSWAALVHAAIRAAHQAGRTIKELQACTNLNFLSGVHDTDAGFKHVDGTTLSVQGTDANKAWIAAWNIAQLAHSEIEADFEWRDKEQVSPQLRGQQGTLRWFPNNK